MNVVHLLNGLWVGGTERSVVELIPALKRHGVQGTIVCLEHRDQGVEEEAIQLGLDVRFIEAGGWLSRIAAVRRILREEKPDLVHSALFTANMVARWATLGTGIPVINSLVNQPYSEERLADPAVSRGKLRVVQALDAMTAGRVTCFHAVSMAAKRSAVETLGLAPERIEVVERGRDPERLGPPSAERKASARAELGLDPDALVLVSVGRQDYQKDQATLMRSMPAILAKHPNVVLLLVGRSGTATPDLERLHSEPGLAEAVRLLGHRNDVPDILAAADLFALPSRFEGLPGAVIEAMALSLPVIAAAIPSVEGLVIPGDTGELVPVADSDALASVVVRLLSDNERRKAMGERGREVFLDRFRLDRSAERMAGLYERVAGGGGDAC